MKIEVIHKDGSRELSKSPLILQKGDIVIIDGKISDFDSFNVGTNDVIITMNGESFIIQNTQLLGDNIAEYDNFNDLMSNKDDNHTALAFEEDKNNPGQDYIIDEENSLFDLTETEAGEEKKNSSTYYNAEFLERNDAEVQIEAKLNEKDFVRSKDTDKDIYGANDNTIYNSEISPEPVPKYDMDVLANKPDIGGTNANADTIETESEVIPQTQNEEIQEKVNGPITAEQNEETSKPISSNEENNRSKENEEIIDARETEDVTVPQDEEIQEKIIVSTDEEIILSDLNVLEGDNLTFTLDDLIKNNNIDFDIVDISDISASAGTITEDNGIYTIDFPKDFSGTIELSYTITNGSIEIPSKSLINVENVNDLPEVTFINPEILEDGSTIIELNISDADNDKVTVEIFNAPENGSAIINKDGNVEYTPIKDFNGNDTITIKINDSSEVIYKDIEISIEPTNDEPIIEFSETDFVINEDSEGSISFDISDIDGDNTLFSVKEPNNGTIIVDGTTINYIPNENFAGTDSISIDYTDGIVQKTSIININITEVNDNPIIEVANEILMIEDTIVDIAMNVSDIDSEDVTINVDTDNGVAIIDEDGNIIYSPNQEFNGTDTIIITATDSDGGVTTKGITVQIDNDNTDTHFEIITSTISGTETEIVEHIGSREIQTTKTRIIEVIDEEANTEAGITQNSDGEWVKTVQETEVYTETVTEEKTREIEETFTNTRIETEEFINTRIVDGPDTIGIRDTNIIDSSAMEDLGYNHTSFIFKESFEDNDYSGRWRVIHDKDWDDSHGIEIQDSGLIVNSSDGDKLAELDAHSNTKISKDFDTSNTDSVTFSIDYQPRQYSESSNMSIEINDNVYNINFDGTVSDGIIVTPGKNGWNNYIITESTPNDNTKIIISGEGTSDSFGALIDNIKIQGHSENWFKTEIETFTNTRTEIEEFTDTRNVIVEFQDTREVMVEVPSEDIVYETEEYIVNENIYEEEFTDTRDITVEFEDTRIVQEQYTEEVEVQHERLVDVEVPAEPIMKEAQEDYISMETEEYIVQEEVQVQVETDILIMDLTDSEYDMDLSSIASMSSEKVNEINIDDNKLSNISMDDIMDLSSDNTLTIAGSKGGIIDLSDLPEGESVQKVNTIQIQDETFDTYSYSDSLGQELQIMIDTQIQVDL